MDAVQMKNTILAAMAVMGTFIANELGGWDAAMQVLVALMVVDYITGVLVAAVWHRSNSGGIRPALVLPSTALFDKTTLLLKGVA